MTKAGSWLLPDGVEDLLPQEAGRLESLRRRLLDLYAGWGYRLIITPLVEYLDSLLLSASGQHTSAAAGDDLDLHTFKITDQLSGRLLGVRADITPQAARIDAHSLGCDGPVRLCYAGSVLHTRPRGLLASRIPIRVGAELFGHAGPACDIELVCLMHATLQAAAIDEVTIVLGHVGVLRRLVAATGLPQQAEAELFEAVQRKAYDDIEEIMAGKALGPLLRDLARLSGGPEVLATARRLLREAPAALNREIKKALAEAAEKLAVVEAVAAGVKQRLPALRLGFDLCELRGYRYHSGVVFAAYTPAHGSAVAAGGRYDRIGEAFGRARPASGFDCDLKTLAALSTEHPPPGRAILAPDDPEPALQQRIEELRAAGEVVISDLGDRDFDDRDLGRQRQAELGCDRRLVKQRRQWVLMPCPEA